MERAAWTRNLGGAIRKYRKLNGLTQRQAALDYGCSLRWWQTLEMGRNISVGTLIHVGKVLVIKPWRLLRW